MKPRTPVSTPAAADSKKPEVVPAEKSAQSAAAPTVEVGTEEEFALDSFRMGRTQAERIQSRFDNTAEIDTSDEEDEDIIQEAAVKYIYEQLNSYLDNLRFIYKFYKQLQTPAEQRAQKIYIRDAVRDINEVKLLMQEEKLDKATQLVNQYVRGAQKDIYKHTREFILARRIGKLSKLTVIEPVVSRENQESVIAKIQSMKLAVFLGHYHVLTGKASDKIAKPVIANAMFQLGIIKENDVTHRLVTERFNKLVAGKNPKPLKVRVRARQLSVHVGSVAAAAVDDFSKNPPPAHGRNRSVGVVTPPQGYRSSMFDAAHKTPEPKVVPAGGGAAPAAGRKR